MNNKQLLIEDLAPRLMHGVKVDVNGRTESPYSINVREGMCQFRKTHADDGYMTIAIENQYGVQVIKPYLRELSDMTDVEYNEFQAATGNCIFLDDNVLDNAKTSVEYRYCTHGNWVKAFNWLDSHHFDYRGLIGMNLAIRVTKENNPYI